METHNSRQRFSSIGGARRICLGFFVAVLVIMVNGAPVMASEDITGTPSNLWAWGENSFGQLGDGSGGPGKYSCEPVPVSDLTQVKAIAAGRDHSLALKSDGTVWTWGRNDYGQLGDGTTEYRYTPVQVDGLIDVVAIAAGYYHSLALKSDGTVWTWGRNNYGQLGDGSAGHRSTPVQVKVDATDSSGVSDIAAGQNHSLALKTDGTVWAWGDNLHGQLGDPSTKGRLTPGQVSTLANVMAVAAGYVHSLALKTDGTVWAWGDNLFGQLGDDSKEDRLTPVLVSGLDYVIAIEAGYDHSLALRLTKGGVSSVWAWGSNAFLQLGKSTKGDYLTPVQVVGLPDITAIATAFWHNLALGSDGTVWAWGSNAFCQLGDGTTVDRSKPVKATDLSGVKAMAAGYSHNVFKLNGPPVAEAGDGQSVHVGDPATLNGGGSYDPDDDPLTYSWSFTEKPEESEATLDDSTPVNPTFIADLEGDYVVSLVVSDGELDSEPDTVTISTTNVPPVADAGDDRSVDVGEDVTLNGSESHDPDGDPLTYSWAIESRPDGSSAELDNSALPDPTFNADVPGTYVVSLVVSDGYLESDPDTVTISTTNVAPVADAGGDKSVYVDEEVTLDGSMSTDPDDDLLTYSWSFTWKPWNSKAKLHNPTLVEFSFTPDIAGIYVVRLVVHDGTVESKPDNVAISAVTQETVATGKLQDAIDILDGFPREAFKWRICKKALTRRLHVAILMIEKEKYEIAWRILEKGVLKKMDGCTLRGSRDTRDWINDCDSQNDIYPVILDVIEILKEP